MTTYAIGDIQGCLDELKLLLDNIRFDPASDQLWLVGDIVNRGPKSLETLRYIRDMGDSAITVLGNHDLHLLAIASGAAKIKRKDTIQDILDAPDSEALLEWLRHRPLLHFDETRNQLMVHAGLPPQWSAKKAGKYAREAEAVLQSGDHKDFFEHMYGDLPDLWDSELAGWDRIRYIINALTRMRYCNRDGRLELGQKGKPGSQPKELTPWFEVKKRKSSDTEIIFGHWSTLGLYQDKNVHGLDSGCLWGGVLTVLNLDDPKRRVIQLNCQGTLKPGK
jgi:bis(5'-nucleosyl)-tetraphosphatase (symmetrical)